MNPASIVIYILIGLAVYFVVSTIITLRMYIVVMKWKKKGIDDKNASWFQKAYFSVAVIADAIYNYTSGALTLWQTPRSGEVMFTHHLRRIMKAHLVKTRMQRYRLHVAQAYCFVIEKFDAGHCIR